MTKWTAKNVKPINGAIETICGTFNCTPLVAWVMLGKGFVTTNDIKKLTNSNLADLYPLKNIEAVKKAFSIIENAINNGVHIYVYGDYDVDGVTSTVILTKTLKMLGAKVDWFIPDRHKEGYGLNGDAIRNVHSKGCRLLVTCDNGVASINEISLAKSLGMEVVVLDHHEPQFEYKNDEKIFLLPEADALVDMKLKNIDYPFRNLCAGGLCYKFAVEFCHYMGKELTIDDELVIFAALATVCDVVELKDENRIIVRKGLELINNKIENKGLRRLSELNKLESNLITEYAFGFVIGPCINAGGRLELAALAAELFVSEDENRIEELATKLYSLNAERKEMTLKSFERMSAVAENLDDRVLVLFDESVDESIAGIVAGRVREKFDKPCIVLTKGEDSAKGSGRSIDAYDMFEELSKHKELFIKMGGHKMAAGMSLPYENIDVLRTELNKGCTLTQQDMERVLVAEKIITLDEISVAAAQEMEIFRPYGMGNSEPLFGIVGVSLSDVRLVGNDKNIVICSLRDNTRAFISAVWFNGAETFEAIVGENNVEKMKFDIMATLKVDEYRGNVKPKLFIKDMRISRK